MPSSVTKVVGKAVPLDAENVDTDQIIPAQFCKFIEKKGLGRYLFYRWRFDEEGHKRTFILDREEFKDATVLVTGRNFGIGSSREFAVWSLYDFGIRCVVSSSFGDIFYANASKNGLVCVRLPEESVAAIREASKSGDLFVTVDLERMSLEYEGNQIPFAIEPYIRERIMKELDDISITVSLYEDRIRDHESRMPGFMVPKQPRFITE